MALVLVGALSALVKPAQAQGPEVKVVPQHLISAQPGTEAFQPRIISPAAPAVPPRSAVVGTELLPVIPIEFSDVSHSPAHSTSQISGAFNGPSGSVNAYYREASGEAANPGRGLSISASVANWVRSTRTMSYYGQDSASGIDDASGPIYRLVTEAVQLADAGVNFATFDRDGDGVVDHVVIVHAGPPQESSGNSNHIWSHRWVVIDANPAIPGNQPLRADNVQIYGYIMTSEDSPIGVVSHELGHDFGLPDFYDTDGSSSGGVGEWDIMATGSWNRLPTQPPGSSPAHVSAYSKAFLGWETPVEVTAPMLPATIQQAESSPSSFKLPIKRNAGGEEYFLVENREQVGFDAALPGRGLLIWHVDTSVASNADDLHRLLDLEEADEGISGERPRDATDPWVNSAGGFGPFSRPNSNAYGNVPTGWKVRNIGSAGPSMTADLTKEVADDLAVLRIAVPAAARPSRTVTVTVQIAHHGVRPQAPPAPVEVTVYHNAFAAGSEVAGFPSTRSTPILAPGASANLSWSFTVSAPGRYIVLARVSLPLDEIPENNQRLAAFPVRPFLFFDDVEAGAGNWTSNDASNDLFRWSRVDDAMPVGSSHSPSHAWRFGYLAAFPPNLLPPRYHLLTSEAISISSGPLYLGLYQRYDLYAAERRGNVSDDGWIQVSFDSGPWTDVGHITGADLPWNTFSANLTALATGASTLRIRFNATSDVMSQTGGWWVDDITVITVPLGRAVAVLPIVSDRAIEPGATAAFVLKAANIGELSDTYGFSATLPAGWTAAIGGNSSTTANIASLAIALAPNAEATLQLLVTAPTGVVRGTVAVVPLVVRSTVDGSASATFSATTRINDPVGLGTLTRYAPYLAGLFLVLGVIVIVIDSHKKRKFHRSLR